MAVGNGHHPRHNGTARTKGNTAELAARLAPVEEQQQEDDIIRVDASDIKLSKFFLDEDRRRSKWLRPQPIVMVIIGLAITFIGFIAYLIWTMPSE